jgi:hypothetical protein
VKIGQAYSDIFHYMSLPMIYIGGWDAFRQEKEVTKEEEFEDFSWTSERLYYEDCRTALDRVQGARYYLRESVEPTSFSDPIGNAIKEYHGKTGSDWVAYLGEYRQVLKSWTHWVLATKEAAALKDYEMIQAPHSLIDSLCVESAPEMTQDDRDAFLLKAQSHGVTGTLTEVRKILRHIYVENLVLAGRKFLEQKKVYLNHMVSSLIYLYKHPIRWFDTPYGSALHPCTTERINNEAMIQMEALYPDYRAHIEQVKKAFAEFTLPTGVTRYSRQGEAYTRQFLIDYGLAPE